MEKRQLQHFKYSECLYNTNHKLYVYMKQGQPVFKSICGSKWTKNCIGFRCLLIYMGHLYKNMVSSHLRT